MSVEVRPHQALNEAIADEAFYGHSLEYKWHCAPNAHVPPAQHGRSDAAATVIWAGRRPSRAKPSPMAGDDQEVRLSFSSFISEQTDETDTQVGENYMPRLMFSVSWSEPHNRYMLANVCDPDHHHVVIEFRDAAGRIADPRPLRPGDARFLPGGQTLLVVRRCLPGDWCAHPSHGARSPREELRPTAPGLELEAAVSRRWAHLVTVEVDGPPSRRDPRPSKQDYTTGVLTNDAPAEPEPWRIRPHRNTAAKYQDSYLLCALAAAGTYGPGLLTGEVDVPDITMARSIADRIAPGTFKNDRALRAQLETLADDLNKEAGYEAPEAAAEDLRVWLTPRSPGMRDRLVAYGTLRAGPGPLQVRVAVHPPDPQQAPGGWLVVDFTGVIEI